MTYEQILALLDKGLTPDQIMALDAAPTPQDGQTEPQKETGTQQPTEPSQTTPEAPQRPTEAPQAQHGPTLADVLQAVHGLTQAVQASAIMSMTQPQAQAPETALDVMRQISNPFNNYNDKTKG